MVAAAFYLGELKFDFFSVFIKVFFSLSVLIVDPVIWRCILKKKSKQTDETTRRVSERNTLPSYEHHGREIAI